MSVVNVSTMCRELSKKRSHINPKREPATMLRNPRTVQRKENWQKWCIPMKMLEFPLLKERFWVRRVPLNLNELPGDAFD